MVKEIQLTLGKVALVDDEDYEFLNQWKWYAHKGYGEHWYAVRKHTVNGKQVMIRMHYEILKTPKGMESDHKDGNGLNNQRYNLRVCTRAENQHNQKGYLETKTSAFKGVSWHKKGNSWRAQIGLSNKRIHLGSFATELEAALAYNEAAKKYFGEFARLNQLAEEGR